MANDVLKFVDSIAASPTTRLDLNTTSSGWKASVIDPGVPPTSLSVAQNAMRDGGWVSSSVRGMRTITLGLTMTSASQDTNATAIQNLVRELDREWNYLMFQPDGASKPVFFRTYRATPATIQYVWAAVAHHAVEIQLQADPWALGLLETVSVGSVSNNPTTGCYFDVAAASCIGDVPAPLFIQNTTAWRTYGLIAKRHHGTPSDMVWVKQAESCTLGANTTNPGGAADALMSGSGTTNYVRTTFGTATMASRVTWDLDADITTQAQRRAMRGTFRVLAAVRKSASTSTITARAVIYYGGGQYVTGNTITIKTPDRHIEDFGVFDFTPAPASVHGVASTLATDGWPLIQLQAARNGGTDDLDWDAIMLAPADESTLIWGVDEVEDTSFDMLIDGHEEHIYIINGANPFASTAYASVERKIPNIAGTFPALVPNQINRFVVLMGDSQFTSPIANTNNLTLYYYPRYLFIRPSAT